MKLIPGIMLLLFASSAHQQPTIPGKLQGSWTITRILNTRNVSCWGDREARALIGTTVVYSPHQIRWKSIVRKATAVTDRQIWADEFSKEYSGGDGYTVDFPQLGIDKDTAEEIAIEHSGVNLTGATSEIPGDRVWFKSPDRLVMSVCSVYFEAQRATSQSKQR